MIALIILATPGPTLRKRCGRLYRSDRRSLGQQIAFPADGQLDRACQHKSAFLRVVRKDLARVRAGGMQLTSICMVRAGWLKPMARYEISSGFPISTKSSGRIDRAVAVAAAQTGKELDQRRAQRIDDGAQRVDRRLIRSRSISEMVDAKSRPTTPARVNSAGGGGAIHGHEDRSGAIPPPCDRLW